MHNVSSYLHNLLLAAWKSANISVDKYCSIMTKIFALCKVAGDEFDDKHQAEQLLLHLSNHSFDVPKQSLQTKNCSMNEISWAL